MLLIQDNGKKWFGRFSDKHLNRALTLLESEKTPITQSKNGPNSIPGADSGANAGGDFDKTNEEKQNGQYKIKNRMDSIYLESHYRVYKGQSWV